MHTSAVAFGITSSDAAAFYQLNPKRGVSLYAFIALHAQKHIMGGLFVRPHVYSQKSLEFDEIRYRKVVARILILYSILFLYMTTHRTFYRLTPWSRVLLEKLN
jgi:hypothetical protein